jgi:hypothetical protein
MKLESIILTDFFDILNKINADYCVMNNYWDLPEVIPSDVDFAIDIKTFGMLDVLVMDLANKHNVAITQKIWHGYNKCAFILSPLNTERYFWLQLDFFVDFSGKGFPNLLPNSVMLKDKRKYKNFYIPATMVEVPFILQRRIFKGDIKREHLLTLKRYIDENPKETEVGITSIFGADDVGKSLVRIVQTKNINLFNEKFIEFRKRLHEISRTNTNFKYHFKYSFNQVKRAVYRLYYPTGISIGFVGKDLPESKLKIDEIDSRISGSFHGTSYLEVQGKLDLMLNWLKKVYWPKVTKRKVYINSLTTSKLNNNGSYSALNLHILKPDIIFNIESTIDLNNVCYQILKAQSKRTNKHMNNKFSPTASVK